MRPLAPCSACRRASHTISRTGPTAGPVHSMSLFLVVSNPRCRRSLTGTALEPTLDVTIGLGGEAAAIGKQAVPQCPWCCDRRVDDELQDKRCEDAANHRRRDPFPHVGPGPGAHIIGMSPMNVVAIVMNFGRSRFAAPPSPNERPLIEAMRLCKRRIA
jgi:hypothetical protein